MKDELRNRLRPLPIKPKHIINSEYFRKFTKWERIKILFGYNFVVMFGAACQHNPGGVRVMSFGSLSEESSAAGYCQTLQKAETEVMMTKDLQKEFVP